MSGAVANGNFKDGATGLAGANDPGLDSSAVLLSTGGSWLLIDKISAWLNGWQEVIARVEIKSGETGRGFSANAVLPK